MHHLFVFLPPLHDDHMHLPESFVFIQAALEGNISRNAIMDGLGRGLRAGGDLRGWWRRRFLTPLSFKFRESSAVTPLSLLEAATSGISSDSASYSQLSLTNLSTHLAPFDLQRLQSYAENALDYHVVQDLLLSVTGMYFEGRLSLLPPRRGEH